MCVCVYVCLCVCSITNIGQYIHKYRKFFINKKWKNSAMNCEAYFSVESVSSYHRIVTAKIRLSLRKNPQHELRPPNTMTEPFLTTEILEINMY